MVTKLFNLTGATRAYFGQKDAQQLLIIKKMVQDLDMPVTVIGCPIVREADGVAMSSRNTYLTAEERLAARCLSQAVNVGEAAIHAGMKVSDLVAQMQSVIDREPLAKVDYLSVVDMDLLQPVEIVGDAALVAMAVYIGKTRLIDNFIYRSGE